MQSENLKIGAGYVLICLLWGSTWLAIKVGLESLTPFISSGIRFLLASLFIYILMLLKGIKTQRDPLSIKLYITLGFFSFVIPFGLVYWAEQFVPSGLASVLFAVFPFFVIIFSRMAIPSERIDFFKVIGVIIGFTGIVVIFWENISFDFDNNLLGMLAVLLSATMQAMIAVIMKKYGKHLNVLSMNLMPLIIAGVTLSFFGLILEDSSEWDFNLTAVSTIIYLSFFGTLVTFTTYYWLLKRMNVVILSLSAFITPIIALILGWLILGELLSLEAVIGSALVLIGILSANYTGLKKYLITKRAFVG
jgi:drug/metabolite transporter (DMT)-like permease